MDCEQQGPPRRPLQSPQCQLAMNCQLTVDALPSQGGEASLCFPSSRMSWSSRDCHTTGSPPTASQGKRTFVSRGLKNAAGSVSSAVRNSEPDVSFRCCPTESDGKHKTEQVWSPERQSKNLPRKVYPWRHLSVLTDPLGEMWGLRTASRLMRRVGQTAGHSQLCDVGALDGKASVAIRYQRYVRVPNVCSKPGKILSNRVDV